MYREKDYNRKQNHNGNAYDPHFEEPSSTQRPKVPKSESVFDDPRVAARRREEPSARYREETPTRPRAVRAVPRRETTYERSPRENFNDRDDGLYMEDSIFRKKNRTKTALPQFPQKPRRKHKEKRRRNKPLLIFMAFVVLIFGGFWFYVTGNLNSHPLPRDKEALGITDNGKFGVTNIAFFGVDTRDDTDTGRSDAMMVLSLDLIGGDVKMVSLLRDSKVPIEGHGETKLNHAYAYGGPELAVKTINQVFDLNIKEFVTVNFNQLSDIVDAVGGVTLEISEAEKNEINRMLDDDFPGSPHLDASGSVVLDGHQAISYSRIRSLDSDNARTDRQQNVLNAIFASVKGMGILEYPRFVHDFSAIVETSLSSLNVLKVSPIMLRNFEIERYTVPDGQFETDLRGGKDADGVWYWHYDLDAAAARLHSVLYGK